MNIEVKPRCVSVSLIGKEKNIKCCAHVVLSHFYRLCYRVRHCWRNYMLNSSYSDGFLGSGWLHREDFSFCNSFSVSKCISFNFHPRNSIQLPLYSYMLIFLTAVNSASVGLSIIVVRLSLKNHTRVPNSVCKLVTGCSRSNLARIFLREKSARNTDETEKVTGGLPEDTKVDISWLEVARFIDLIAFWVVIASLTIIGLVLLCLAFT